MLERRESEMLRSQEIMFVDDEIGVRESWQRVLAGEHRTVRTAVDAESAIDELGRHAVDLVICDLRLPGADGLAVLKWINKHKPGTRFVLITGYGSAEVEKRVRHLGGFGYLEKPVQPDVLEAVTESALWGDTPSWMDEVPGQAETWIGTKGPEVAVEVPVARPEPAADLEASKDAAIEAEAAGRGTLGDLAKLASAPFLGLAFIVFLPLLGFGAVGYAIGAGTLKLIRSAGRSRADG